jgi:hypothetical protein
MTQSGRAAPQHGYTFQVTLLALTPPVWRLLAVPSRLTLADLHEVIQLAMGWERKHSYRFDISGKNYETGRRVDGPAEAINPAGVTLEALQLTQGSSLTYIYDFKDDWVHHLTVQGVAPSILPAPVLLGGSGACPPESSGGPGGYSALIAALRAPESDTGKDALARLGSRTDPSAWDATPAAEGLPRVAPIQTESPQPPPTAPSNAPGQAEHRSKKNRRNRR